MEGYRGMPPSSAIPFFWAPGWNSVQAVTKYQEEPGGHLRGGDPGIKLFHDKAGVTPDFFKEIPEAFKPRQQKWLLLPQYDVLGSGELSVYTKGIKELSPQPVIVISVQDATPLNVKEGEMLQISLDDTKYVLPAKVDDQLCNGIVLVSAGLYGMEVMNWGTWVKIEKVNEIIKTKQ
jgi:NADH-quinone oxidoreductase subunit G